MPSINLKKYKSRGINVLTWLSEWSVFDVMRLGVAVIVICSLCYFAVFGFGRQFAVIAGMTIVGLLGLVSMVFDNKLELPKTQVLLALGGFAVAVVLAGLFSGGSLRESFFGFGVEIGTVSFVVLCAIFTTVVSGLVTSNKQIFHFLNVIVLASAAIVLLSLLNAFIFGGAISLTVSPITVGILSLVLVTAIALVRQFFIQLCQYNIFFNFGTIILGVIGVVGLFVVHDFILWLIAGTLALASVTYTLLRKHRGYEAATPWASVVLFFLVLVGLFVGGLSQYWQNSAGVYQERPGFTATMNVTRDALLESPIFGVGPQKFAYLWDQEKPLADIVSPRSHVQYNFGFGYFPTFIATTGLLGLLALAAFLALYVGLGVRIIRYVIAHKKDDPLTLITWMMSFVLLLVSTFLVGDMAVVLLTGLMIGLSLASSVVNGHVKTISLNLAKKYRKIPYQAIVMVLLLVALIFILYITARSFAASQKYKEAARQPAGDLASISMLQDVVRLYPHDAYMRALANQYSQALTNWVQREDATPEQVQVLVDGALATMQNALVYNPDNYLNYQAIGNIYRQLGSFGVPGAYDEALQSYDAALVQKPYSGDVLLNVAQLHVQQQDLDQAKQYVQAAFNVAPTRPNVYVVAAQIALAENNLDQASTYLAQAVRVDPLNPRRWSDLGVVLFSAQQYEVAAESFARAIALSPNQELYYYLALSLKELGRTEDVDAIYKLLEQANSNLPISNLKAPEPAVVEVLEDEALDEGEVES